MCQYLVSDEGSHFKDQPLQEFSEILQKVIVVTTYSPWTKITVEIVWRCLESTMRSLLSELRMQPEEWPALLPVVQSVLNHTKSAHRGGFAPITIFTGLTTLYSLQATFDQQKWSLERLIHQLKLSWTIATN